MIDSSIIEDALKRLGLTHLEYKGDTGYTLPAEDGHMFYGVKKDGGYYFEVGQDGDCLMRVFIPIAPGQEITDTERQQVRVQLLIALLVNHLPKQETSPINHEV